jgi:DNA primase
MVKPMHDIQALLEKTDLLALIESDLGPGKKSGRWHLFHCPFPGHAHGDRRESLTVTTDNGRYYCFACRKSGDALNWLCEYRGMSFREACEFVDGHVMPIAITPHVVLQPENQPVKPPDEPWQSRGADFCLECQEALWETGGQKALAYLRGRGLGDEAIQIYQLGLNPEDRFDMPAAWGLPEEGGKPLWIPKGITIPAYVQNALWSINIRRPAGDPKYFKIRGSRRALYGADNLVGQPYGLLVEGEFDCITADQEIGRLVGVATMGSSTNRFDLAQWGAYLMTMDRVLVAYDADKAGNTGAEFLTSLGGKVHRAQLPDGAKDINAFHQVGGNLNAWIVDQLAAVM